LEGDAEGANKEEKVRRKGGGIEWTEKWAKEGRNNICKRGWR
jgi:hypothetical protein